MSDVALSPPTAAQLKQLEVLYAHGAVSFETALGPYDGKKCDAMLIGRLWARGWTASKSHRPSPGAGQRTAYWLTPAGVDEALLRRIGL